MSPSFERCLPCCSKQIYAAADIVLVPSMFEPCGLTPLAGMCRQTVNPLRVAMRCFALLLPTDLCRRGHRSCALHV